MIFAAPMPSRGEYLAHIDRASQRIILTAREALLFIPPPVLLSDTDMLELSARYCVWIPMQNDLSDAEFRGILERCEDTILPCFFIGDPLP